MVIICGCVCCRMKMFRVSVTCLLITALVYGYGNCTLLDVLIRPPVRSNGRSSVLLVMYLLLFLFRHSFSELPRPIALKLCHMVGIWLHFIIPLQKLGGGGSPPPKKKLGAKNMQNFGQFWTTSDFDREYLRNG